MYRKAYLKWAGREKLSFVACQSRDNGDKKYVKTHDANDDKVLCDLQRY